MSELEQLRDESRRLRSELTATNKSAAEAWQLACGHRDEAEQLRKESQRLQQDRDAAIRQLADEGRTRGAVESERDQLRDENRRLRGALEWIRDAETHFYTEDTGTGAMRLPDLLRNWAGPLRSIFDTSRQALAQPAPAPAEGRRNRYYIDCEFDGHNGPLLSMAIVRGDGESIYITTTAQASDRWVIDNVVSVLHRHESRQWLSVNPYEIGATIRSFIPETSSPIIIADSPVDIGRFYRALSTDRDGGWASAEYPSMRFEVHNVDCYPNDLPNAVKHNAWWDAMALRHKLESAPAQQPEPAKDRLREMTDEEADALIERVEDAVGMDKGAWDMTPGRELARSFAAALAASKGEVQK